MVIQSDSSLVQHIYATAVGEQGTGKTSLCRVLTLDQGNGYSKNYDATCGVQTSEKWLTIGGQSVHALLLDCSGRDVYEKEVLASLPLSPLLHMFVFDVTSLSSFDAMSTKWIPNMSSHGKGRAKGILIGGKCDLSHRRVVGEVAARKLAQQYQLLYAECSAKDNTNVLNAFKQLLSAAVKETSS